MKRSINASVLSLSATEATAEALKMAKDLASNPRYNGEEIRISLCTTEDDYCDGVIIVREGNN